VEQSANGVAALTYDANGLQIKSRNFHQPSEIKSNAMQLTTTF